MKNNFLLIISGIISLIILFIILSLIKINNYNLEKTTIYLNNQNITLYKLNLNIQSCYQFFTNGYFIIYPIYYLPELGIPAREYVNISSIIVCNESLQINKTISICSPLVICPTICTTQGCACSKECYNVTYYLNISSPIIIINNSQNTFFIRYNKNIYSSTNNIDEEKIANNYLYDIIINYIKNIPTIIV
ncbi:hypothetical protein YN1_2530 [Nanoarchaeota archaeon]